MFIKEHIFRRE